MSVAVKWTGPGSAGAKPFFLCVNREGRAATDEWSHREADKFENEKSAITTCEKIELNPDHFEIVPFRGRK